MIRLSVTDLETFRHWKDRDDTTVEQLLAELRGQVEPSHQMQASRAFHQVLEHIKPGEELSQLRHPDGWIFDIDFDGELYIPPIRELKAERIWQTPSGPVTLVGKVDNLSGLTVADYKLSERFEAERYLDSYQWRAYLAMFSAQRFVYHVFQCAYGTQNPYHVEIYELHHLPFDRYPEMLLDLDEVIDELAAFVKDNVPEKVAA